MESQWRFLSRKEQGQIVSPRKRESTFARVLWAMLLWKKKKIPFIILILSHSLKTYFRTPRKTFYESKAKYNMLAIKWDNIMAQAEPRFSPPRLQAAAERNVSIIFQVIKPFRFDFGRQGERKRGETEVKRIQSYLFFNQKELLRRVIKEIGSKQNQPWDGC